MKAPETIFLHGYSFDDEPCKDWTIDPKKRGMRGYVVQNEKYIRKGALLEWVKLAYGKLSMNPFDVQDVFEELIDKIESL